MSGAGGTVVGEQVCPRPHKAYNQREEREYPGSLIIAALILPAISGYCEGQIRFMQMQLEKHWPTACCLMLSLVV